MTDQRSFDADSVEQLGKIIRHYRKIQGLRQDEAAGLLGVGVRFLSELERGKTTLEVGKVLQVVHGLGLQLQIVTKKR
jgi:y4mF family transcriptional regulator